MSEDSSGGTVVGMSDAAPPAPSRADWRRPVRWFGIACLMGAAFFAGYVVWLLWGTGLQTARAQNTLRATIDRQLLDPLPISQAPPPGARLIPGSAYGVIEIPSIGVDMVVVEGTAYEDLKKGPGHYPDTANPWDGTGRVGIAGHRTTYLAPFFNLDEVRVGNRITLLTKYGTFVYRVTRNFVMPEQTAGVVLTQTVDPTLVLTTCNPKYGSSQRLIVTADLVKAPGG